MSKLKRALVESHIGAIALGYLLAEAVLYFIGIFSSPVATWLADKRSATIMNRPPVSTPLLLQSSLPQFMNFLVLVILWYILLRWLYLERPQKRTSTPVPSLNKEQSA